MYLKLTRQQMMTDIEWLPFCFLLTLIKDFYWVIPSHIGQICFNNLTSQFACNAVFWWGKNMQRETNRV